MNDPLQKVNEKNVGRNGYERKWIYQKNDFYLKNKNFIVNFLIRFYSKRR